MLWGVELFLRWWDVGGGRCGCGGAVELDGLGFFLWG